VRGLDQVRRAVFIPAAGSGVPGPAAQATAVPDKPARPVRIGHRQVAAEDPPGAGSSVLVDYGLRVYCHMLTARV
jgi:hypothetical protein